MTVQMRELQAKDTFTVIRLAKKLGITTSIVGLLKQQEKAKDLMSEQKALIAKSIGWQVILEKNPNSSEGKKAQSDIEAAAKRLSELETILNDESFHLITNLVEMVIDNIDGFEDEIFKFLGELSGMTKEEFSEISLLEFAGALRDFFEKPELREVFKLLTPSKPSAESTSSETNSTNATIVPMT